MLASAGGKVVRCLPVRAELAIAGDVCGPALDNPYQEQAVRDLVSDFGIAGPLLRPVRAPQRWPRRWSPTWDIRWS